MWLWMLWGCNPVCGTAEFQIEGSGASLFDVDSDGDADLTERCGIDGGSFGYRRDDYGVSQLILDSGYDANGKLDFAISTYVLPIADVWFLTDHLEVGNTIGLEQLAGSGIHIPGGEPSASYLVYPVSGGTLEVVDFRASKNASAVHLDGEEPEDWRLRWDLSFGGEAQHWAGEDWVQITRDTNFGDPSALPPDWVAP